MNDQRRKIILRDVVCAVLTVLLVIGLGYLYYTNQQREKAQTASLEALQEAAAPYESELQELRAELSSLQEDVSYAGDEAGILVGFILSDASDLSYIEEKAETYGFEPVLILDCTMDTEDIEAIVAAADADREIMLYATNFSEESNEDVKSVIAYLESAGREHCGVFFLRSDYSSAGNLQRLAEDGFLGYTSYNDSPAAGQTEDGMIWFDYSHLTVAGTSVTSRLTSLYAAKTTMIIAFDMASINSGSLSEEYVVSLLDLLQDYAEKDDASFITVADAVQELSEVNSIEAENQAAYEEQAAAIEERIGELQEIIDGIYDGAE